MAYTKLFDNLNNQAFKDSLIIFYKDKFNLSKREIEILLLFLLKQETNKEISERLFVAEKTIKFHFTNIFKKLGVKSRTQVFQTIPASAFYCCDE